MLGCMLTVRHTLRAAAVAAIAAMALMSQPHAASADDGVTLAYAETGHPIAVRGWGRTETLSPLPKPARTPRGFAEFCGLRPADCFPTTPRQGRGEAVALTPGRLAELDRVNRAVNNAVHPITDERLYDRIEKWTYPRLARLRLSPGGEVVETLAGDCEDYVLLKRAELMKTGWPADALLITVVRDLEGLGHAVLTVRTDRGDLVLDNQTETIAHWRATGYSFIKRQSARDPRVWVSLGTPVLEAAMVGNTTD